MSIFQHTDYRNYIREWFEARPKQGYGESRKLALHLGVSSTMISQVLQGTKDFNAEMAIEVSEYLGLNETEERYFQLLVSLARAGSHKLKDKLRRQIREQQEASRKIATRVQKDQELSSEDRAVYYSSWLYTGLRNVLALPGGASTLQLAERLQVPEKLIRETLDFLLGRGIVKAMDGRYEPAGRATHIPADHPLVIKHHQNWRLRGMQKMDLKAVGNTFYTGPMSLSREDVETIRQLLVDAISRINKVVVDSPSETVRCLNIDWFEY